MKRGFAIVLICFAAQLMVAQDEVKISDIEMLNLGDGSMFARYRKDEKPVNGKVRLITGYTTAYTDARFDKGYADGKWVYYKQNVLTEERTYSKGLLHGERVSYHSDGKTVKEKATMKNGKVDGLVVSYYTDGKVEYETGWKDGLEEGPNRHYDESGKVVSETIYKNGKADGKSFRMYNRGQADGYTLTQYYKEGKPDGEYSEIFESGAVKSKGKYVNGVKEGVWESTRKDGRRLPTEEYKNGKVIKRITYFTTNKVDMERNMDESGKRHGVEISYDNETGKVKREFNYVHDKQVGKQVRYYYYERSTTSYVETANHNETGQKDGEYSEIYLESKSPKIKGQYSKDKKEGKWTYYDENGKISKEETYEDGRLINRNENFK